MPNQVSITQQYNTVTEDRINYVVQVINPEEGTITVVQQTKSDTVEVQTPGPRGPVGPQGPSGSIDPSYNTGSFSGSFTGDGSALENIPSTAIVGLNLSQISSGSVSASISEESGLQVNTNVTAQSFTGSFSGSGAELFDIPSTAIVGLNLSQISSGSVSASISEDQGLQINTNVIADSFTGSFSGSGANLFDIPASGIVGLNLSEITDGNVSASVSSQGLNVNAAITASGIRVTGDIVATTLVVETVSSSVIYSSGSNIFGDELVDKQTFTGSVDITGSLTVNDSPVILSNQTASMSVLSSSFATTASYVLNAISASYVSGSAAIINNLTSINDALINGVTVGRGNNSTSVSNVTVGSESSRLLSSGLNNTAVGQRSLYNSTTGNANTAIGNYALLNNVSGFFNTAVGASAAVFSTGNYNTAIGVNALARAGAGDYNIWIGYSSAPGGVFTSGYNNTIIGSRINLGVSTLSNNIILADGTGNIKYRWDATQTNIYDNLAVTGSVTATQGFTGSLFGTASWSQNALTASYVATSSYAPNIYTSDGTLSGNRNVTLGGNYLQISGSSFTSRFTSVGRLLLGTTSESTNILEVTGTSRFSDDITINKGSGNGFLNVIGGAGSENGVRVGSQGANNRFGLSTLSGNFYISVVPDVGTGARILFINRTNTNVLIQNNSTTINYANAFSLLELSGTGKGFLPTRMTETQLKTIAGAVNNVAIINGGSGYTDGAYYNRAATVTTSYGTGTVVVTADVVGGTVTNLTVGPIPPYGTGYQIGDIITSFNGLIGGTGFVGKITGVTTPTALIGYQTDNVEALSIHNSQFGWSKLLIDKGQVRLRDYITTGSFTGSLVGLLGFDSSGNILTTSTPTDTNIYNSDGTLSGDRTIFSGSGYTLTLNPLTRITNDLQVTGSLQASSITGSLSGTSSFAVTASYASLAAAAQVVLNPTPSPASNLFNYYNFT